MDLSLSDWLTAWCWGRNVINERLRIHCTWQIYCQSAQAASSILTACSAGHWKIVSQCASAHQSMETDQSSSSNLSSIRISRSYRCRRRLIVARRRAVWQQLQPFQGPVAILGLSRTHRLHRLLPNHIHISTPLIHKFRFKYNIIMLCSRVATIVCRRRLGLRSKSNLLFSHLFLGWLEWD